MSVLSVEPRAVNPVTVDVLDGICEGLGVSINDEEKEEYRKLLGVFHESALDLMAMDGMSFMKSSRIKAAFAYMGRLCSLHGP